MPTEAEAATKVCPQARYFDPGNGAAPLCAGPACMAWRWGPKPLPKWRVVQEDGTVDEWNWNPRGHKGYERLQATEIDRSAERTGWCGLSGVSGVDFEP